MKIIKGSFWRAVAINSTAHQYVHFSSLQAHLGARNLCCQIFPRQISSQDNEFSELQNSKLSTPTT